MDGILSNSDFTGSTIDILPHVSRKRELILYIGLMIFVKNYVILLKLKKARRIYGRNFTSMEGTWHDKP